MQTGGIVCEAQEHLPYVRAQVPEAGVLLEGGIVHSLPIVGQVAVIQPQNALPQPLCHLQTPASVSLIGLSLHLNLGGQKTSPHSCIDNAVSIKIATSLQLKLAA